MLEGKNARNVSLIVVRQEAFFFLTVAEWIHVLIFSGQKLVAQSSTCVFFSYKRLSDNMI